MKVGLIGESVTMHYLDYYCEKHKDRIAGFSDVRDDKKYQEDDIDFIVYRKDGSSFTVEAKADTYKTGNVFLETAVNSFAIGEDDKLLRYSFRCFRQIIWKIPKSDSQALEGMAV